jgi:hypothetical protein
MIPQRTVRSKVDSNIVDVKSWIEQQKREIEAQGKAYDKAQSAFVRQRERILTDEVVKKSVPMFQKYKRTFDRSFLKANGDVDKIAEMRAHIRKSIDRALLKSIPKYKQYRALRKAYSRKHVLLSKAEFRSSIKNRLGINIGDVVISVNAQEFTPAYLLHDVYSHTDRATLDNRSFVEPHSGVLALDFRFAHVAGGVGGYNPAGKSRLHSALGINYQVPETGRLSCSAVIQSIYNNVTCSVTDYFGFSHANLTVYLTLFIDIIRSGERSRVAGRNLIEAYLNSDGDDKYLTLPEIPTSTPFTIFFNSADVFQQSENIQILVGSSSFVQSDLDDMESIVDALAAWHLKKISVGIQA